MDEESAEGLSPLLLQFAAVWGFHARFPPFTGGADTTARATGAFFAAPLLRGNPTRADDLLSAVVPAML